MNKDPSEYYVDKVTKYIKKTCFERQSQVENTTKAPEQVLQSNRKRKTWPCKKRKNDMKLRYFEFSQIYDIRDVKNSPRFAISPIKTKFSAFAHYYLICDVNFPTEVY